MTLTMARGLAQAEAGAAEGATAMSAAAGGDQGAPRVVLVDDHGLFRSGVRAELGKQVEVVGEADDVAPAMDWSRAGESYLTYRAARCPPARRWRSRGHHRGEETPTRDQVPRAVGLRRAGGRDRGHPASARGYVTKTISTADLADAIGGSPAVTQCSRTGWRGSCSTRSPPPRPRRTSGRSFDPELDQLTSREREVLRLIAPGLHLQGGGPGALHLGEDRRKPCLLGSSQAPALLPAPADPLGRRASADLIWQRPDFGPTA